MIEKYVFISHDTNIWHIEIASFNSFFSEYLYPLAIFWKYTDWSVEHECTFYLLLNRSIFVSVNGGDIPITSSLKAHNL